MYRDGAILRSAKRLLDKTDIWSYKALDSRRRGEKRLPDREEGG